MSYRTDDWDNRKPCRTCGAVTGEPCKAVGPGSQSRTVGAPLRSSHAGRFQVVSGSGRVADQSVIDDRLTVWRREALKGTPVAVIAEQLGMSRAALDQFIHRQRRAGHPAAVYHSRPRSRWDRY